NSLREKNPQIYQNQNATNYKTRSREIEIGDDGEDSGGGGVSPVSDIPTANDGEPADSSEICAQNGNLNRRQRSGGSSCS
ncbi:hypothetical protein A2U01_0076648, partial [Trifolium medium]|nr:hypothetical protein [Trifolium medium]